MAACRHDSAIILFRVILTMQARTIDLFLPLIPLVMPPFLSPSFSPFFLESWAPFSAFCRGLRSSISLKLISSVAPTTGDVAAFVGDEERASSEGELAVVNLRFIDSVDDERLLAVVVAVVF